MSPSWCFGWLCKTLRKTYLALGQHFVILSPTPQRMQQDNDLHFTRFATDKFPDDLQVEAATKWGQSLPGMKANGDGFEIENQQGGIPSISLGTLKEHKSFFEGVEAPITDGLLNRMVCLTRIRFSTFGTLPLDRIEAAAKLV